jgi:hypothetical protein
MAMVAVNMVMKKSAAMNFTLLRMLLFISDFESGLLNQYFLSAGGIRLFHFYYSIPWIGVVECYLGAFAVGHSLP